MSEQIIPEVVPNWIGGEQLEAASAKTFDKLNPATGEVLCRVARSEAADIDRAVAAAKAAQPGWADVPPVQRGMILHEVVLALKARREEMARMVALETGKAFTEALGETDGAAALGLFYASEGQRLYGKTTTSGVANKKAMTVRQPVGLAGLIIAANTPVANVAWKVFPALICGNAAILKAAEDAPGTAWLFAEIAHAAGLPEGVLNVVQGLGVEAGRPLVAHPEVGVISFTGSSAVGREIAQVCGGRLAKVSLELGGKNALVVCDDADLDNAAKWVLLSAFSNAGQRCVAGSRVIVFESIYDEFKELLIDRTERLKVGPSDDDDFGPVINERQLSNMLVAIETARKNGARVLTGGHRLTDEAHAGGFYLAPTIIEGVELDDAISTTELFGPITCLYKAKDFAQALEMANDSPYGLSAAIHTRSFDRALEFCYRVETGVAVVNAGTYGSEPHMPFGGVKLSGNGSREPGTEALDIYSDLKDVYLNLDPNKL